MEKEQSKAKLLLNNAYELTTTDIDRARQLADDASKIISEEAGDTAIEKIRADMIQAEWYRQRGQYPASVIGFLGAIEGYETYDADEWLLFALYRLGMVYTLLNYHSEALDLHVRQFSIAEKLNNYEEMGNALRRIGLAYYELQQDDRAIENYHQSLSHFQQDNNKAGIAGVYNNLALLYQRQGKIELAIDYAQKAVTLFEEADYVRGQAIGQGTLTSILTDAGDLELAMVHAKRNIMLAKELKIQHTLINAYLNLGRVYAHINDAEKAFEYYNEAYQLIQQQQDIVVQKAYFQHLAELYKRLGDYENAIAHQQVYHELEILALQNASDARFEFQAILHQTKQAQSELTQQKLLREEERNHYERLTQMKDELISNATHDLKNPLASIKVMTYLLSQKISKEDVERVKDIIKQIDDSVDRMRDLISDVLDLARLETGKTLEFHKIQLDDYIQATVEEFKIQAEQKGIQLVFDKPRRTLALMVDPLQIQQVLRNLLSNAVKYTPKDGNIYVSFQQVDKQVIIEVQDTGFGIPEKDLPFIFERFYRVDDKKHKAEEGTGLGLAICKSIIEQHQGTITVDSTEGKGTSFFVTIPIRKG